MRTINNIVVIRTTASCQTNDVLNVHIRAIHNRCAVGENALQPSVAVGKVVQSRMNGEAVATWVAGCNSKCGGSSSGFTRRWRSGAAGGGDSDPLEMDDTAGDSDDPLEDMHAVALDKAEDEATAKMLEDAGVDFTEMEDRRMREMTKKFMGHGHIMAETPTPFLNAHAAAGLDPYTEDELERKNWSAHPEDKYDWRKQPAVVTNDDMTYRRRGGLQQLYCVFCYHGAEQMRPENTTLLNKFISDRGKIIPRRTSFCCAKHQRKLRRTIKRARQMQLLPYSERLHPKLRATRLMPDPATHKPVTFTTPRDAFLAAQKFERWTRHSFLEYGNGPKVDWFPDEE